MLGTAKQLIARYHLRKFADFLSKLSHEPLGHTEIGERFRHCHLMQCYTVQYSLLRVLRK